MTIEDEIYKARERAKKEGSEPYLGIIIHQLQEEIVSRKIDGCGLSDQVRKDCKNAILSLRRKIEIAEAARTR